MSYTVNVRIAKMTINSISGSSAAGYSQSTADDVRESLMKLAQQHNTTMHELVEGAKSAGMEGAPYQIRALNLQTRLERLEK